MVALATLAFVVWARLLPYDDWPLGDGWNRYLGNAIVLAEGRWEAWHAWRGPVHAGATLALTPLAGTLVRASQAVALLSTAALLPLTWALARRLVGPRAALVALGLLLAWPDLRLFAWFSGPYPLQGALLAGGALALLAPARAAPLAAGLCLGLAAATDARAALQGAALLAGLAGRGATPSRALAAAAVAGLVGTALVALLPADLHSLRELAALQRAHAAPLVAECARGGPAAALSLADLLGPCARGMLALNLDRAREAVPDALFPLAPLAALGLLPRQRAPAPLGLLPPLLVTLPSVLLVAVQHRYLVPLAPFAAVLAAAGLDRLGRGTPWIGLVPLAAGLAWHVGGPTLLTRAGGARGGTATADLARPGPVVLAARAVRDAHRPGERVLDCANGNLRERLWPIPVETVQPGAGGPPRACRAALAAPGAGWVLVRPGPGLVLGPGWTAVTGAPPGVTLYRGP